MGSQRKGKRKNSEKRKEKSRDAARCRRTKECEIFNDLADALPIGASELHQLDKASIIRLTISYLKLRTLLSQDKALCYEPNALQRKLDMQYEKALEGFILVLAKEGDIMFLSENVSKYLGISQIELIGQSIYEFTHPCDHDEIHEILMEKSGRSPDKQKKQCSFLMRMKCTLTSKGRNINLKSANYKVIRCSGRYESQHFGNMPDDKMCLLLIAEPIPHPSNIEVLLDGHTFVTRHSLDMKITHCDERIYDLLGYKSQHLIGQSVFNYHHAHDSHNIREAFKDLFSKGQSVVSNYRFLVYGGGYCHMQTEATIINNQRTGKPQYVVCVNYMISEIENRDVIMSPVQQFVQKPSVPVLPSGIILSTETIFAPRPDDADSDMLQITDVEGKLQMLNDLLELAPSAGSVLMDFESDIDMSFMNKTEPEPMPVEQPIQPKKNMMGITDPTVLDLSFLNESRLVDSPPMLISPGISAVISSSPMMSQSQSPRRADYLLEEQKSATRDNMDDMDFDLRAPYIPMDGSDDLLFNNTWVPLVDDDMFNSHMIGITESVFEPKPPEVEDDQNLQQKIPLSILRLQSSQQLPHQGGEIARNAGPPKMKRPMETNRLENGPPKVNRRSSSVQTITHGPTSNSFECSKNLARIQDILSDTPCSKSGSVLMNLLTKGEDVNFGYRVPAAKPISQIFNVPSSTLRELLISSDEETDQSELVIDVDDDQLDDDFYATGKEYSETVQCHPKVIYPPSSAGNHTNLFVARTNNSLLLTSVTPTGAGQGVGKVLFD